MIGGTLYLVVYRVDTGEFEPDANSCQMCRKMIINSGIEQVIVRDDDQHYRVIQVKEWVQHDDLLEGKIEY